MKAKKLQSKKTEKTAKPKVEDKFPMRIPESQGDLADRAEEQIEADLQEEIEKSRHPKK